MQNAEMCIFVQPSVDRTDCLAYTLDHGKQTSRPKQMKGVQNHERSLFRYDDVHVHDA